MHRGSRKVVTDKDLEQFLPTAIQKSYYMLSDAQRAILNTALAKYRAGQSEPILVGGIKALKPALRLMTWYRLKIEEVLDDRAVTSYAPSVDAVQVRGSETKEVCLTFSPQFERLWQEFKKRPKTECNRTSQPIRLTPLRLGEKPGLDRQQAHYTRATSRSARAGSGKGC